MNNYKNIKGFSLIELLMVVIIIGVIISIALPSYQSYKVKGMRQEAQAAMMKLNNEVRTAQLGGMDAKSFVATTYRTGGSPEGCSNGGNNPCTYSLQLSPSTTGATWQITAFPIQGSLPERTKDGTLVLTSKGERCRNAGINDKACIPTQTFSWD